MASRADFNPVDSVNDRKVILTGIVALGASGALGTGATDHDCDGFTVTKTASETGRYTATLHDYWKAIEFADCVVEVAADDAVTDQKGVACVLRGVSASGKVAYFQILGADGDGDFADREPIDSAKLRFLIVANRGRV